MMFCDRCDRGYHSYCVGLEAIPDGSWQCSACDPPAPPPSSSPAPITKGKRGRPSSTNRSSPRQQQSINSPKLEILPTRVSSRRSRKILSTPLSPSNNTNHSSNSSSTDVQSTTTNSPSVNLILSRHQQQWTTTTSNNNNNNNNNNITITSTNQR
ncbi:unnamed protein product [Rotaria sp. Silwood1]|nr:unnamed protein product [Rotaria sp. Silwood1]CAF3665435.1 unnamed protein product [Rotaria sp. Silwood1]